jgi:hypothetical protein
VPAMRLCIAVPRGAVLLGALSAGLVVAACGGGAGSPDGPMPPTGPCWPLDAMPGGQVELGTGQIDFEPMGDTLPIITSSAQADPFVRVHARIRGMPPGDPDKLFDPRNPRTKARLEVEGFDKPITVDCPASFGYRPAPESGAFDLKHSLSVGFGFIPIDPFVGKQARVVLEVVGSNGLSARDEKLVTLVMAPP